MTTKLKIYFLAFLSLLGIAAFATISNANPLYFPPTAQSATATSSVTYFATGTATSTVVSRDSYSTGQPFATDKGTLLIQMVASSTSSVLNLTYEYSQDGIDWYSDNLTTTSGANTISLPTTYAWTAAGTATSSKALSLPMPTRYVRVRASVSGAAAGVWMQIVPQVQGK